MAVMLYPEYRYVDVSYGGVGKRNNLVQVAQARPPKDTPDCYRTVYRYPEDMREHFAKTHSVGGYNGPVYADWLPVDIDSEDLDQALEWTRQFINQLYVRYDIEPESLMCFFSGAKGFHVLIPQQMVGWEPGQDLPQRMRRMAQILADGIKVDTTVYDRVRLFRFNNTRNSKTNLFKIPLSVREILFEDMASIKAKASQPRASADWRHPEPNAALQQVWTSTAKPEQAEVKNDEAKPDRWSKPCIARMLQGGLRQGNRQAIAFRLAVHLRKQGMDANMVVATLREWNKRNHDQLEDRELIHAAEQGTSGDYDFGCRDPILESFCSNDCVLKRSDNGARNGDPDKPEGTSKVEILDFQQAQRKYEEYVALLRKAKVTFGIPAMDNAMRGIAPGEACWIAARAGVGKTAFLLNILANNSAIGVDSLFCTLEQPAAQIYERAVQIAVREEGRAVEGLFIKTINAKEHGGNLPAEYHRWTAETWQKFNHVRLADADCMSMEDIETAVSVYRERFGQAPRIVAIDYLGRMDGGYGSPYEVTSKLAKQVKSVAKKLKVAVIVIHQVSREGGDGSQEVSLNMLRDSGQAEEAADFVIGLWRPELKDAVRTKQPWEKVKAALLKCRKGPLIRTTFNFDKAHMTFTPENDSEE